MGETPRLLHAFENDAGEGEEEARESWHWDLVFWGGVRRGAQGRTGSGLKPGLVIPPDRRGLVFAYRGREMGIVIVQDRRVSLSHTSSSSATDCEDGEGSVGGLRKEEKEIAVLERQRDREEREKKTLGF